MTERKGRGGEVEGIEEMERKGERKHGKKRKKGEGRR
jgi:hypothetical protein